MSLQNVTAFLDCARWQSMLCEETSFGPGACVGVLRRDDFAARNGSLLLLKWQDDAMQALTRPYAGSMDQDIAVLLVTDEAAAITMQQQGLASLRILVRQGKVHPYILKTMAELEAGGLEDFIEDLWLTAPHH